jgi:hypothetical protein
VPADPANSPAVNAQRELEIPARLLAPLREITFGQAEQIRQLTRIVPPWQEVGLRSEGLAQAI